MDTDIKMFVGKVLGEVYKLQYHLDPENCTVGPERIYGLVHGIETAVQDEISSDYITREEVRQVLDILARSEEESRISFSDLQDEIAREMIDDKKLNTILTYLKANGQFSDLIQEYADEEQSPTKFDVKPNFA